MLECCKMTREQSFPVSSGFRELVMTQDTRVKTTHTCKRDKKKKGRKKNIYTSLDDLMKSFKLWIIQLVIACCHLRSPHYDSAADGCMKTECFISQLNGHRGFLGLASEKCLFLSDWQPENTRTCHLWWCEMEKMRQLSHWSSRI